MIRQGLQLVLIGSLAATGCSTLSLEPEIPLATAGSSGAIRSAELEPSPVTPVSHTSTNSAETTTTRPAYAQLETLPIDLPTVLRLVDSQSTAIGIAQARVREAYARLDKAELQWLPNLTIGAAYNHFDGNTQNQAGNVFSLSRGNLFAGGGPGLMLDTADAYYRPLIERRQTSSEQLRSQAVLVQAELDAVSAYLDLVQQHGLAAINAETLTKAESMLKAAENARTAKLDRTAGDVQRAQSEVLARRIEKLELEARCTAASARLARQLMLQPGVKLLPADVNVAPLTLIDANCSLDQLVSLAVANRPDLASQREAISAAWARVHREESGYWFPKLALQNQTGGFGGGLNGDLQQFKSRNVLGLQVAWELKNLGWGNRADAAERRAMLEQTQLLLADGQSRILAELVEAAQLAGAKYESLTLAQQAVEQAEELYRINKEGTFNVVDAKNLFDALRPLQSIQVLNNAKQTYLAAVLDYNRAQYRLFSLLGHPASTSLAK